LDESNQVKHRKAITASERDLFRKSKYVQSELGEVFLSIKPDLLSGKKLLFSGTPCQVAGLRAYLVKDYETLITCDVICHGVPSPRLFADYLAFVEKKYRSGIKCYDFRPKENGWGDYSPRVTLHNGRNIRKSRAVESYIRIYFTNLALRPSCYVCRYTRIDRNADFTLGDFWGIAKHYPEFADEKGVSLLMVNTDRGRHVFEQVRDQLFCLQTAISECIQTNLHSPTRVRGDRRLFWDRYAQHGYAFIAKQYGGCNLMTTAKEMIKRYSQKAKH
jgi:coenzyme F420-reducing hydrogenase beta subunit